MLAFTLLALAAVACLSSTAATATLNIPTLNIAPGVNIPLAGLGTWQYNDTVAEYASSLALRLGYTHIDTAIGYGNQVGIAKALKASSRPRDSYFITSKIPGGLPYANATAQLELSLQQLGLDYVDLMLVHYPATWGGAGGKAVRADQWRAMEDFQKSGKAKAIGVSHYCERHIDELLETATIVPAINQVFFHVGMATQGLNMSDMPFPTKPAEQPSYKGVAYQAFSSLCGPCNSKELVDGELVTSIGLAHNKTGAQVSLRWVVQQGIPVLPKTDREDWMMENVGLFDFELTADEMAKLTAATSPQTGPTSGDCDVL